MEQYRKLVICLVILLLSSSSTYLWISSTGTDEPVPLTFRLRFANELGDNASLLPNKNRSESAVRTEGTAHTLLNEGALMQAKLSSGVSLLPDSNSMPFPQYLRGREELEKGEWLGKLRGFLSGLNKNISPHLNTVFGDFKHRLLVLNWITAALHVVQPPLKNILVLSLDPVLCGFLTSRTIPVACVAVSKNSIFIKDEEVEVWLKGLMVRIVLLRVINYWGYDVASYDTDAVLLKNPQVLYDERPNVQIFSAAGTFPPKVSKMWGFTLCAGTVMIKATPATGILLAIDYTGMYTAL